jgi:hypothetical protein
MNMSRVQLFHALSQTVSEAHKIPSCASSASSGRYKWGKEGVNYNVVVVSFGGTTSRIGEKVLGHQKKQRILG